MFEPTPYPGAAVNGGSATTSNYRHHRPFRLLPNTTAFRLLCHASRIGGVIGKSGSIIKQLQNDTAAKIRIEDAPPNTDDRVITVIASSTVNRTLALKRQGKEEEEEEEGGDCEEEVFEVSAAQEALVRVFERVLNVAAEAADGGSLLVPGGIVSSRLLADTSLVGSVIGKGGKVIEKIRKDTGCKIRILGDKLPACALPTDEMIEIEGDVLAIKKALVAVSRCLQDCSQADKTRLAGRSLEAVSSETLPDVRSGYSPSGISLQQPFSTSSIDQASVGRPLSVAADVIPPIEFRTLQKEVSFRILCNGERVGGVIGKGGTIVRGIQNDTGASISVAPPVTDCDERLITVSAMESPESQLSPAQNAVVLVFSRSVEVGFEREVDSASRGAPVSARLLVQSNQVGCLLGKGGSIIADMRKVTGAFIKIIGDNLPKCASENDQVVQMTGELVNVQNALHNVAGRLRNNLFSGRMQNGSGRGSSSKPDINLYGRGLNPSSIGHSSTTASPSQNHHSTLNQSMDNLSLSRNKDHPPSPGLWKSQAVSGANLRTGQDVGRGLSSVKGGLELGSGNRSVIVTNSTVEIIVPQNVIGSVLGENGSNLTRLRQISGAKVVLHEPRPGTSDRMVVISGTPDETQAAQSLLQAFILTDKSS